MEQAKHVAIFTSMPSQTLAICGSGIPDPVVKSRQLTALPGDSDIICTPMLSNFYTHVLWQGMDSPSCSYITGGSNQSFLFSILPASTPLPSSCGTRQDFHLPSP